MKNGLFLLLLCMMIGRETQAQTIIRVPPLTASRATLSEPVQVRIWDRKTLFQKSPFPPAEPRCRGGKEQHIPFFCKLEIMSMQATHIWFKIHAGDYDSYSRRRW